MPHGYYADGTKAGRRKGTKNGKHCPRCGAIASQQRCRLRDPGRVVDMSSLSAAGIMDPVDGVVCPHCGEGFRVVHLETWDGGIVNFKDEFDCVPKFCPMCGRRLTERD